MIEEVVSRGRGLLWFLLAVTRAARGRAQEQLQTTLAEFEQRGRDAVHAWRS